MDKEFAGSDTGLYVRVRPTQWRINEQFFYQSDFIKPDKVEQIRQYHYQQIPYLMVQHLLMI